MRSLYKKIWPLALCVTLLLSQHLLYGRTAAEVGYPMRGYPAVYAAPSILRSPLHMLFPFESFKHEVCRKPVFSFSIPLPSSDVSDFHFTGVLFKANAIGPHYIRLNEQLTFRKGNSYLLLPHMSTMPADPDLNRVPLPTVNLPRPD